MTYPTRSPVKYNQTKSIAAGAGGGIGGGFGAAVAELIAVAVPALHDHQVALAVVVSVIFGGLTAYVTTYLAPANKIIPETTRS